MGINTVIWTPADGVTEAQVEQVNAGLSYAGITFGTYDSDGAPIERGLFTYCPAYEFDGRVYSARITVNTWLRYFGPWYTRGNWPAIAELIVLMRQCFHENVVHYGDDEGHGSNACTASFMTLMWGFWDEAVANGR